MTDFLVVAGISMDTINKLKNNNNMLFALYSNKTEVIEICNYLRMIGIKDIDGLLLYKPEIFLETKASINYHFSKFDIKEVVSKINEDIENIDLVC